MSETPVPAALAALAALEPLAVPKARGALLRHLLEECRPVGAGLAEELAVWLGERPRFEAFASTHRNKIRKKLRTAGDGAAVADVRAELLVAYRLLMDRRFEVAFEAYGSGNRGPDLTVAFRTNQRFNVEVTRLRAGCAVAGGDESKLTGVLVAKLRQLPAAVPNVLALVEGAGQETTVDDVAETMRRLKGLADRKAEATFTRRGFESTREFYAHYLRLSGVAIVTDAAGAAPEAGVLWTNPEARQPLPRDAANAMVRCLVS